VLQDLGVDLAVSLLVVRFVKFVSVLAYAGSVSVGLGAAEVATRKRAVHVFASPALVVIWLSGYLLTLHQRIPLGEAWIVGGFVTSLVAHVLLGRAARLPVVTSRARALLLGLLALTLFFMVFRPTWWSLWP
jgi:hypothetical protein